MHGFNAGLAVGAVLFALLSAPLFHVHNRDHDGGGFLHAHFLEREASSPISSHLETEHSPEHLRWIDVFTLNTPPITAVFYATAETADLLPSPAPVIHRAANLVDTARAHSPPTATDLALRSPPTL
jgi:hypothetical protein